MSIFDWFRKPQPEPTNAQADRLDTILMTDLSLPRYLQRISDGEDQEQVESEFLEELELKPGSVHAARALALLAHARANTTMHQARNDYQAVLDAEAERYASKERRKERRKVRKTVHSI